MRSMRAGSWRKGLITAVVILPPTPYETIAGGEQARIRVLYNEIDPARRQLVPDFVRVMVGDINRELFLQSADQQQEALSDASANITLALRALDPGRRGGGARRPRRGAPASARRRSGRGRRAR